MYFPTQAHTDACCTRAHIRRISRDTADNERGCLSPFVTAVPASMRTESLAYFSISLCLFSVFLCLLSPRLCRTRPAPQTIPIYRTNSDHQRFPTSVAFSRCPLIYVEVSINFRRDFTRIFLLYNILGNTLYSVFSNMKCDTPTKKHQRTIQERRYDLQKGAIHSAQLPSDADLTSILYAFAVLPWVLLEMYE